MITYPDVQLAYFLNRPNRFIAECRIAATNELVIVHVKNTGRCKELLLPNSEVALSYQPSPKRKTSYDLIAVKKAEQWINIDSQIPNYLAEQAILNQTICLPNLEGNICRVKREQRYRNSKFDLFVETDLGEKAFVEVKGMTLENQQLGAFPDAPTIRGLKHVTELIEALEEGYKSYILFIIQFPLVKKATIHKQMQPALAEEIARGEKTGLQVLSYNCQVTPATIQVDKEIPFDLLELFEDPNI